MGSVKGLDFTLQALESHGKHGGEWRCGGRADIARLMWGEPPMEKEAGEQEGSGEKKQTMRLLSHLKIMK